MDISKNIFISRPTVIEEAFERCYSSFEAYLHSLDITPRRLGRSDYSYKAPLRAVMDIIDQCCGTIVMGYPQLQFHHEVGRSAQVQNRVGYVFPTPWNQIEGALAFRANTPVLVVAYSALQ
jgi:hypothetical protein